MAWTPSCCCRASVTASSAGTIGRPSATQRCSSRSRVSAAALKDAPLPSAVGALPNEAAHEEPKKRRRRRKRRRGEEGVDDPAVASTEESIAADVAVADGQRRAFTYRRLQQRALCVAKWIAQTLKLQDIGNIGNPVESGNHHDNQRVTATRVVALMMENRADYAAWTLGGAYCGVTVALINTNLGGEMLGQAVRTADARHLIVTGRTGVSVDVQRLTNDNVTVWLYQDAVDKESGDVKSDMAGMHPLVLPLDDGGVSEEDEARFRRLRSNVQPRDPFVYIYTSGTTGPSKAARFSHRRWIGCGLTWARPGQLRAGTNYYIALPLYHGYASYIIIYSMVFILVGSFSIVY